ncbi:MAG: hypothetical protein ABFS42_01975 [Candidatus Krumholzibacteriota bacterium]
MNDNIRFVSTLAFLLHLVTGGVAYAQEVAAPSDTIAGPSWTPSFVVLEDDRVITDVTVRWVADGSRLHLLRSDGGWMDVHPDRLMRIVGSEYRDLRAEVMAARPAGAPEEPAPATPVHNEIGIVGSEQRGLAQGGRAKVFGSAWTASAGWGALGGDAFSSLHPGLSLMGTIRIGISGKSWLGLAYRNQAAGGHDFHIDTGGPGPLVTAEFSRRFMEYCLVLGRRLGSRSDRRPFMTGELGLTAIRVKTTAQAPGFDSESHSGGNLGIVAQLGVLVPMRENSVLDLQMRVGLKPSFLEDGPGGTFIAFHAGVGWVSW